MLRALDGCQMEASRCQMEAPIGGGGMDVLLSFSSPQLSNEQDLPRGSGGQRASELDARDG